MALLLRVGNGYATKLYDNPGILRPGYFYDRPSVSAAARNCAAAAGFAASARA